MGVDDTHPNRNKRMGCIHFHIHISTSTSLPMYQPLGSSHTNNEGQADGRAGRQASGRLVRVLRPLQSELPPSGPAVGYKRI